MNKIILTSNYESAKNGNIISISGDKGKSANFNGKTLLKLSPEKNFWRTWRNNIGKIREEENTLYYIENYYKLVLKKIDPAVFVEQLPNKSILLCYEESKDFCHRHLVAFWLELFLDINTYEVKEINNKLEIKERPEYLRKILEKIIKEDYNMHGFNCIRAAYLFEAAEILERDIHQIYKHNVLDDYAGELYTQAARLRMDADEAEQKYLQKYKNKMKKYTD